MWLPKWRRTEKNGHIRYPLLWRNAEINTLLLLFPGDIRVNEQPGLTATHTMWVRLHNRIERRLSLFRPRDSQEELFQQTRKIVVAILQNIHYNEWLPLVLGDEVMESYNLSPGKRVSYSGSVDPRIINAFSAAAFRFGHSMIPHHYNISGR